MTALGPDTKLLAGPLLGTVVAGGYCVGCGACASLADSPLRMELNDLGQYRPVLDPQHLELEAGFDLGEICPFSSRVDESTLATGLFPTAGTDPSIGRYCAVYAGSVVNEGERRRGSSGGLTSWLLKRLMQSDLIDGVIHVAPAKDMLFAYKASFDEASIEAGAKSRYYPVEMSEGLKLMRSRPGRYALVGIPCFIKAARLAAVHDSRIAASLRFTVAIFCGHLKSAAYAEALGWQLGVRPERLRDIDFREKLPGRPANRYGVSVVDDAGRRSVAAAHDLFGTDWGLGLFKPQACDFCDDVAGETADIAFGDAWLPEYTADSRGTNVVVTRDETLDRLLAEARAAGEIVLDDLRPSDVVRSQAANYRHRRDGLAYRLWLKQARGEWHPVKRVEASNTLLSETRQRIYEARSELSSKSHLAFAEAKRLGDFEHFRRAMTPLVSRYERLYVPRWRLWARRVKRALTSLRARGAHREPRP